MGVDGREHSTAVCGWTVLIPVAPVEVGGRLAALGVRELTYTGILDDGTLRGPDLGGIEAFAAAVGVPVVASGGIGTLDDVRQLARLKEPGVCAVIIGRALYEMRFTVAEAIRAAAGEG